MKRTFWLLYALVAAFAGPAANAAANDPVHIDAILSLTGPAAFIGNGEAQTLKALEEVVNRQGGIHGRPVAFDVHDDQSNPQTAIQLMNQIVVRHPAAIIGTGFTATCNAIMPLSRDHGPVTYCLTPGVHPAAGSYAFSASIGTLQLAPVMLRFFAGKGLRKIAMIASTDASGQDMDEAVTAALELPEFRSIEMVSREHFNVADVSVAAQIARMKAAAPQAAIAWTAGTGFGTVLRGFNDAAFELPIIGGNGNMILSQLAQYTGFVPRELYLPGPRSIAETGVGKGPIRDAQTPYFAALKAAGMHSDIPPTMAWDPAMIVIEALRKLGPDTTPDKVRAYIENLHGWAGIDGIYDFANGSQRGLGETNAVMLRYDGSKRAFITASKPGGAPL